jgi:hypothetical protein
LSCSWKLDELKVDATERGDDADSRLEMEQLFWACFFTYNRPAAERRVAASGLDACVLEGQGSIWKTRGRGEGG